MLDYASLAAVAAVIQEGSFESAARFLNVTPSAVSQRVKLLEERLGRVLVHAHLNEGTLVQLVPGRTLSVPLYWQHTRLQVPMLDRLTRAVLTAAHSALHPERRK